MKKIYIPLALFALYFILSALSLAQSTRISGFSLKPDGLTADTTRVVVTRADRTGVLYANSTQTYTPRPTDGYFSFLAHRTTPGDTTWIYVRANMGPLATGKILVVPNADSATLTSLVTAINYNTYAILVPHFKVRSATDSAFVDVLRFAGTGVTVTFSGTSYATATISGGSYGDSLRVATNIANGKRDADSTNITDKLQGDSIKTAYDKIGDRADADSVALKGDTTLIHQRYHDWTTRQNFAFGVWTYPTKTQLYSDTNVFMKSLMRPPVKTTDKAAESYIPYGDLLKWNVLYDNGTMINRLTGNHAYGWYSGLNPQGILANKEGLYRGIELWQDDQGYPFNLGHYNGIVEHWMQFIDTLGNTHRTNMDIFRRGDGRKVQSENATDVFQISNGSGVSPGSNDSVAVSIAAPRSNGASFQAGTFTLYGQTGLRFFHHGTFFMRGYGYTDTNSITPQWDIIKVSTDDQLIFGSNATTAYYTAPRVSLLARNVGVRVKSDSSLIDLDANSIRLPEPLRVDSAKRLAVNPVTGKIFLAIDQTGAGAAGPDSNRIVFNDKVVPNGATAYRHTSTNTTDSAYLWSSTDMKAHIGFTVASNPAIEMQQSIAGGGATTFGAGFGLSDLAWVSFNATAAAPTTRVNTNVSLHSYRAGGNAWAVYNVDAAGGTGAYVPYVTYLGTEWRMGVGATAPQMKLDVTGRFRCTDTLRIGDFTTSVEITPSGRVSGTALLRGVATIGAADSVDITVTGVLPTDAITLAYRIGKTTTSVIGETMLTYNITAADRLTIFGVATRVASYIRIK